MAKINTGSDLTVKTCGKLVTEISTVYNNHFIKRQYVGMKQKQAVKKFEEDLKKGRL